MNNDGVNSWIPDHSCDWLLQKLKVLQAGNVLESIDNYNQLSALLLDSQVDPGVHCTSLKRTKDVVQQMEILMKLQ